MQHDDFDSHLPQPCKAGGVIPHPGETEAGKGAGGCLPQAHSRYGLGLSDSSHSPYYLPTSLAIPGLITTPRTLARATLEGGQEAQVSHKGLHQVPSAKSNTTGLWAPLLCHWG